MIGFLLGAGFSKSMHSRMPLMSELVEEINRDEFPLHIQSDIEAMLSYLWSNNPWHSDLTLRKNQIRYLELTEKIHRLISDSEYHSYQSISRSFEENKWKFDLANYLTDRRNVILTMNYDTLLERLMIRSKGAPVQNHTLIYPGPIQSLSNIWSQYQNTGYTYDHFDNSTWFNPQLYKLHGSISWYSFDVLESSSVIYGLSMDKYYIDGSRPDPDAFDDDTLHSVIIPPVSDKISLYTNKFLRSQWRGSLQMLSDCTELYCIGYSFPKSDYSMRIFLAEACSNIQRVHIVNRSVDDDYIERLKPLFPNAREITTNFTGNNCVREMFEKLVSERPNWSKPFA